MKQQTLIGTGRSARNPSPGGPSLRYFLFINTKSGNKEGLKYSQLCPKRIKYIFGQGQLAYIQSFDMFDQARTAKGFRLAKHKSEEINEEGQLVSNVRLMICGGDGTIPWVLHCAQQAEIDFRKVTIGILPIGTGNDFSRSIGWGYSTLDFSSFDMAGLHAMVGKWNKATIGHYDIWDIEIEVYEQGCFYDIKNQVEVKKEEKVLKRSFTNYFGIGLDARVVYSVEKKRGSNAFITKLLYTLVGARNFFKSMQSIQQVIDSFKQVSKFQSEANTQKMSEGNGSQPTYLRNEKEGQNQKTFKLKQGYKGLVCLNCTSYMCGLRKVWMTNRSTDSGLVGAQYKQKFDDGQLEFMAFNNEITLALERVMRTGVRIAQGAGPFEINFKQKTGPSQTFMEIDGESVKIQAIKRIRVRKSQRFPEGRIRVLINDES